MLSSYTVQPAGVMRRHIAMIPDTGGVYAFLLDDPAALAPALDRAHLQLDSLRLGRRAILYLGASAGSLRSRLKAHLSNDTGRSTFRMSLGAVLAEELDLRVVPNPHVPYFWFEPEGELRLTAWIGAHVSVALRTSAQAMAEEKSMIAGENPLLNITGRRRHPTAETVMLLRRQMRGLPFHPKALN